MSILFSREKAWQCPQLTSFNALPPRPALIPYPEEKLAITGSPGSSPWFYNLNREWSFRLFTKPEDVDSEVLNAGFEDSSWRKIPVPSNWTLQDTGDDPIYTNVQMPFDLEPPFVPEENPTGVYRTVFHLSKQWESRRTVIHFSGVESAFFVFVNGEQAGFAKDSRTAVEFDLSPWLKAGENHLAVKVIRWSDGSHLEDQDHWWMAGIYRDVYLYSTDQVYLEDIFVSGEPDDEFINGLIDLKIQLRNMSGTDRRTRISLAISAPDGRVIMRDEEAAVSDTRSLSFSQSRNADQRADDFRLLMDSFIPLKYDIDRVDLWSAENPALYRLAVTLTDHDSGEIIESVSTRFGFRKVEVKNRELLINGKPVLIKGVNRHDHHESMGKTVDRETLLKDIRLLKQFNFNAVRSSHYPNDDLWYELCDEYGLYIMDEANIEHHDFYDQVCRDPRYAPAYLDRVMRMVYQHKNHPCIFAWSLGNESGYGPNHDLAAGWIRGYDKSRIIHYEGITREEYSQTRRQFLPPGHGAIASDIISLMYPEVEDMKRWAEDDRDPRPQVHCEYSHAMGNSNGSLKEYFELFESMPGLQGGFIWDWVDQGLLKHDEKGKPFWAYGGDFGEEIHDFDFCINGLVWPDRTPHPAMYEFKKLAQPLSVEEFGGQSIKISNKQYFSSLQWLVGQWSLELNGESIDSGLLPTLDIPPGKEAEYKVDSRLAEIEEALSPGDLLTLTVSFVTRDELPWCEADYEMAWEQFILADKKAECPLVNTWDNSIKAPGPGTACDILSELPGSSVPRLNLWRGATDNDGIRGWNGQEEKPLGQWQAAGFSDMTLLSEEFNETEGGLIIVSRWAGTEETAIITHSQMVTPYDRGVIFHQTLDYPACLPSLPRAGVIMTLPAGFEELQWLGRGPHESYSDRKTGARFGLWQGTVANQYVPYILPQEHGNKTDVKWFSLSNGEERLRYVFPDFLEFSASHYTAHDLFRARHTCDLTPHNEVFITIDLKQRGLGTGSCGPQTRPEYRVESGHYEFEYYVEIHKE